jgi:hypothetical protein
MQSPEEKALHQKLVDKIQTENQPWSGCVVNPSPIKKSR